MKRVITLTYQYSSTLLLYNISFSVLFIVITGFGAGLDPVGLFFCKFFGFASAAGLHYYSAAKTYFYYRNAGIGIKRLLMYACLADAVASLIFIIPFTILLHAAAHVKG